MYSSIEGLLTNFSKLLSRSCLIYRTLTLYAKYFTELSECVSVELWLPKAYRNKQNKKGNQM